MSVTDTIVTEGRWGQRVGMTSSDGVAHWVEVTDDHPFFVQDQGWIPTLDLEVGMQLLDVDGAAVEISSVGVPLRIETTYNLTVDRIHNFFASSGKVLVHNTNKDCGCGVPKKTVRAAYDPISQQGKSAGHWHKFGYEDGQRFPLNDAGRVVERTSGAAHIPK